MSIDEYYVAEVFEAVEAFEKRHRKIMFTEVEIWDLIYSVHDISREL